MRSARSGKAGGAAWTWRTGWAVCLLVLGAARAEDAAPATPAELTVPVVEERLRELADNSGLDAAARKAATDALQQALEQLHTAADWTAKANAYSRAAEQAPETLAALQAAAATPPEKLAPTALAGLELAELQQRLVAAEAQLAAERQSAAELDAEPKRRTARRAEIPNTIAELQRRVDGLAEQLSAKGDGTESDAVRETRRLLLRARKLGAEKQMLALQKELPSYDATAQLLVAERDRAAHQVTALEERTKRLREAVNQKRSEDAAAATRQVRAAAREAADEHPLLQKLVDERAELARRRQEVSNYIGETDDALAEIKEQVTQLDSEFSSVKEKLDAVGLTGPVAMLLRKKRAGLPNYRRARPKLESRQRRIANVQLDIIELEEERAGLSDLDAAVPQLLDDASDPVGVRTRERIQDDVRAQVQSKRDLLDDLIRDSNTYFTKLVDLDASERQLYQQARAMAAFIDERILWVRSGSAWSWRDVRPLWQACRWLLDPAHWAGAAVAIWSGLHSHLPAASLVALAIALLFALRRWLARRLAADADDVLRGVRLGPTLDALWVSALLVLRRPAMVGFIAWQLDVSAVADDFGVALGAALWRVARLLLLLEFLRVVLWPKGLAVVHFGWDEAIARRLRRAVLSAGALLLPLLWIAEWLRWQPAKEYYDSLGRLCFAAQCLIVTALVSRLLRPSGPILRGFLTSHPGHVAERFRHLWYPAAVGLPLIPVLATLTGYQYTAQELALRLQYTVLLVFAVGFAASLVHRWLYVVRWQLARRAEEDGPNGDEQSSDTPPQTMADVVDAGTRRLLRWAVLLALAVGVWMIWSDIFPALGILKQVTLWSTTVHTTEMVTVNGESVEKVVETLRPVTLSNAAVALVVILLAIIAARNIPGLIEVAIRRTLGVEPGVRYAITAISTYIIGIVGLVLACAAAGVTWASVQWLAAAMTVGLGFGLQEIFANFVSGLIILFERPMRVGDTVTVGDISGTVSRIRIRATTITDWDRKELVVPNKEFITGRLINWTLSDTILRVIIRVGIAYGSDTELARRLLLEAAKENPHILDSPEPVALFLGFGDSALDFELRAFIPGFEEYFETQHELHLAVDAKFRKADVVIAFPQRDLHLRTDGPQLFAQAPPPETPDSSR